jgi:myosin heavy subunit
MASMVTYEAVEEAVAALRRENIKPTVVNVRIKLGGGSNTLVLRHLQEYLRKTSAEIPKIKEKSLSELVNVVEKIAIEMVTKANVGYKERLYIAEESVSSLAKNVTELEEEKKGLEAKIAKMEAAERRWDENKSSLETAERRYDEIMSLLEATTGDLIKTKERVAKFEGILETKQKGEDAVMVATKERAAKLEEILETMKKEADAEMVAAKERAAKLEGILETMQNEANAGTEKSGTNGDHGLKRLIRLS